MHALLTFVSHSNAVAGPSPPASAQCLDDSVCWCGLRSHCRGPSLTGRVLPTLHRYGFPRDIKEGPASRGRLEIMRVRLPHEKE